ncbi:hypothetical protein [Streptomyces broussonetiae]|uniref:Lipoprotein n=1 Tax=Streptomyces broussonetiae TaxID=2686304 RepID=A0A6I6MZ86_9ACTN|nr:hypothetical protein [Streptomyces broussonetiae]QHA02377.1 hypothetical protein GQF42_02865 [Streptomyces broussonetiae]
MKRQLIGMTCGGISALALLAGCSDAPAEPNPHRAASPAASAGQAEAPQSSKAAVADHVKTVMEGRLSPDETRFGSGTGSPCSTSSAGMFTAKCGSAAKATGADASFALEQIERHEGFATLRDVAEKLRIAVTRYQQLGCADNPTEAATRHACLEPAALIAQGFPDLRGGANLGLRGA